MPTTIDLTANELRMIIAACAAVTMSGGGSAMWTLCCKLTDATGIEPDLPTIMRMQMTAANELHN